MHLACFKFVERVKEMAPSFFESARILEVGSLDVNNTSQGLRPRLLFADSCQFVGVDRQLGEGVDHVLDAASMPFADGEFDVSFSTEVFEHAANWRQIVKEMARVTKPGGLIFVTCATVGRPVHGKDEWGFGYYGNVRAGNLRSQIRGELLIFEEQYGDVCDVRAAWIR